jgi:hypothetical protein
MKKMTNEQYWMRRDRAEKMESLYDCPIGFPEDELNPRPGIVQNLVFSALLVGIFTIVYFIYINIK